MSDQGQSDDAIRDAILGSAASGVLPIKDALKDVKFGDYEVVAGIGRGGMGEVFLARALTDAHAQRLVALKVLLKEVGRDKELVGMFMDEASIMAQIHHPNVLSVYDFGREEGHYYLAMEYLRGRPLVRVMIDAYINNDGLTADVIASLGADAARGLHAAHTATGANEFALNVVHRDVSPQNIFVTFDGSAKMIDFGVARASERVSRTTAGQLKGKAAYMSPEQIRGQLIDGQSDVFALATCLWEMMAGRRLFKRDTDYATMESVLSFEIQPPSSFRPGDKELDDIVLRALERDKGKRTSTAGELCKQLEVYATNRVRGRTEERVAQLMTQLYGQVEKDERKLIQKLARRTATEDESRALRELSGIAPVDRFGEEITMAGRPSELDELDNYGTWESTPTVIGGHGATEDIDTPISPRVLLDEGMAEEITSSNAEERAKAIQESVEQLKSEHAEWLEHKKKTSIFLKPFKKINPRRNYYLFLVFAMVLFAGAGGFALQKRRQHNEPKPKVAPEVIRLETPIEIIAPSESVTSMAQLKERLRSNGILVRDQDTRLRLEDQAKSGPVWVEKSSQVLASTIKDYEGWLILSPGPKTPAVTLVGGRPGQQWQVRALSVNDCEATASFQPLGIELAYPTQRILLPFDTSLTSLKLSRPAFANSLVIVPLGIRWGEANADDLVPSCATGWTDQSVHLVRVPAGEYELSWSGDGVIEEEVIDVRTTSSIEP